MVQSRNISDHRAAGAGRRIYDLLRAQMTDGTLVPGARALFTRALAAELAVSRTTVIAAYEQLVTEGLLVTAMERAAQVVSPLAASASRRRRRIRKKSYGKDGLVRLKSWMQIKRRQKKAKTTLS